MYKEIEQLSVQVSKLLIFREIAAQYSCYFNLFKMNSLYVLVLGSLCAISSLPPLTHPFVNVEVKMICS
jgi:hypothetical protein